MTTWSTITPLMVSFAMLFLNDASKTHRTTVTADHPTAPRKAVNADHVINVQPLKRSEMQVC
jgi:hypothetical protein